MQWTLFIHTNFANWRTKEKSDRSSLSTEQTTKDAEDDTAEQQLQPSTIYVSEVSSTIYICMLITLDNPWRAVVHPLSGFLETDEICVHKQTHKHVIPLEQQRRVCVIHGQFHVGGWWWSCEGVYLNGTNTIPSGGRHCNVAGLKISSAVSVSTAVKCRTRRRRKRFRLELRASPTQICVYDMCHMVCAYICKYQSIHSFPSTIAL